MERRSFFSVVAGLFAGATRVSPRPSAPPEPEADLGPDADSGPDEVFSPSTPTHTDPALMFSDIRKFVDAHPGAVVLSADDPMSLLLGFSAFVGLGDEEVSSLFTVRITALRGFEGRESGTLSNAAGKRALCADLMRGTA